jgi:hypothetical protein
MHRRRAFTDGEAGDVWSDGLDGVTVAVETEADLLRTFSQVAA